MAKKETKQTGKILPRGRTFTGVVVSVKAHKTAVVEWEWSNFVQKYERYEKKRTKISVHNPDEINAQKGDRVTIKECRPLSKTKKFIITQIVGKEELFAEKERLMEESKVMTKEEKKADTAEKRKSVAPAKTVEVEE